MKILQLSSDELFCDRRSAVTVSRELMQLEIETHVHDFWEIVFILSGSGIHTTGNTRHPLEPGDVLVISSRRSHSYDSTNHLSLVNVLVRDEVIREAERELSEIPGFHALFTLEPVRWRRGDFRARQHLDASGLDRANRYVQRIEDELRRAQDGGLALAKHWLFLLVGFLARGHADSPVHRGDWRMARLISRISNEPQRPVTIDSLAAEVAMSRRSFLRHFKEATRRSPLDYVLRARIQLARALLEESESSITEVAFQAGFTDSNYFSRQFRQLLGCSPRAYRAGSR